MVIQISNIAMITTATIQPPVFPVWVLFMGAVGIASFMFAWPLGLILVALTAFMIYAWYSEVEKKKKLKALSIHLNSGKVFSIMFQDQAFLGKVLNVFSNIFEAGGETTNTTYKIDIQNCKIDNESSFIRDGKV